MATVVKNIGSPYLLAGVLVAITALGLIVFRYRVSRFF